ncbi:MAG TPA: sulfite exporter TauE/SafE family protein [Pleomorphomonadaceae bacterium]|nr:sulfite exporter TauE/SafE family protein [Pleomorphomonadaceae bacterium]
MTELLPEVALLTVAALAASTLAAVAGFGGAAILLPVLVALFGPRDAIPILTIAQLVGNGSRVVINRDAVDRRIVGWFALGGIPAALIGGFLFAAAPLDALTRLIGAFLLASVAWRHIRPRPSGALGPRTFTVIGAFFAFASALVGSIGPLMAPFFLAAGLVKSAYIGTEAAATVVMHVAKLVAYGTAALLTAATVGIGLVMAPAMIVGSLVGKRIVDRLPERVFVAIIEVVLVLAGLAFLIGG